MKKKRCNAEKLDEYRKREAQKLLDDNKIKYEGRMWGY